MTTNLRHKLTIALGLVFAIGFSAHANAQSGTRPPQRQPQAPQGSAPKAPQGSAPKATSQGSGSTTNSAEAAVALGGYCPVCVLEMKKWIKGESRFSVVQDGKTYLFPGEEQKQMFLQNPGKYTPALGGKCTVCLVEMGKTMDGSEQFASMHDGRLFLFPGDEQRQMFLKNPAKYANVDLAAGGLCTVCRVEMQQDVQGKPEFSVIHHGMRYWFPSDEQQKMFLANPAKYEVN